MGLFKKRCWSSPYAVDNSNPNPKKFEIVSEESSGDWLVLMVKYPNCTNFEGMKIMLFKGYKSSKELLKETGGELDPHFSKAKTSPIVRLRPSLEAWNIVSSIVQEN